MKTGCCARLPGTSCFLPAHFSHKSLLSLPLEPSSCHPRAPGRSTFLPGLAAPPCPSAQSLNVTSSRRPSLTSQPQSKLGLDSTLMAVGMFFWALAKMPVTFCLPSGSGRFWEGGALTFWGEDLNFGVKAVGGWLQGLCPQDLVCFPLSTQRGESLFSAQL
jgi:hypothetical protein